MPEADVLYSDVKFTRAREKGSETTSLPPDTTYSEVKLSKTQPPTEPRGSQQSAVPNERSKVTSERVALVLLSLLLAAAVIALGVTIHENAQTMKELQKLKKNLTDDSCLKCETCWKQHGGQCYYFSTSRSSWEESRSFCQSEGGDLVKIDSRKEQSFLEKTVRKKMDVADDLFWIGLTDSKTEGEWLWVDDSPLNTSLSFWMSWEPDNWTGEDPDGENCARMGVRGGATDLKCWFDKSCKVNQKYICEKEAEIGEYMVSCV
ncbi:C-type lectin domain family 4 member E isoform X2 [Lates calcarifer]|uniref:C-type lectin domain family 4 member E isoform X2 n=1 Tax=Lates calcarifer TaxID=8187 RepID=A0AAJ8B0K1_LATCA|nr:C-type lectin domain family 4 member E isoform X2 [Lates calcarifer]